MIDPILSARLINQGLAGTPRGDPAAVVARLGAVQAQDYPGALWALALRLERSTAVEVEHAFNVGALLRTHVLRPTWHFVAPADIRWMLALTAPRIKASMATFSRGFGLDAALIVRMEAVIERALQGGRSLTRAELGVALREAGLDVADGAMLGAIATHAELDAVVCSGPKRGNQHTYALLEERVPSAPPRDPEAALAELTWRYFSSHGPALLQDAAWWSGLPLGQVKRGLQMNAARLSCLVVDGREYWLDPASWPPGDDLSVAYLLPNYDEYTVAYRERGLYYDPTLGATGNPRLDVPFADVILLDGRVVGRWKRTPKTVQALNWFVEPAPAERTAAEAARERYARYTRQL